MFIRHFLRPHIFRRSFLSYSSDTKTMPANYVLGFDIGGTKSAVVLATMDGTLRARMQIPTRPQMRSAETVLSELTELARALLEEENVSQHDLAGISVVCGGPLDLENGLICSPPNLPGWDNVPIVAFLQERFHLPVVLENDANAGALAEWLFGAGKGASHLIYLTMGTGIGGGLILDGRLYHGKQGLAGEIGHQTILPDGPLCACGKQGCLEALASGPAIARLARESLMYGRHKRVLSLAGGKPADITAEHVIAAAKEGDNFAQGLLEEIGTYLGIGIANVLQILNPECVILGTIAVHAGDCLLEPVRKAVAERCWAKIAAGCRILPAGLGTQVQDYAAIAPLIYRLLHQES